MPLYEYRCERCGTTFEKLVPHTTVIPFSAAAEKHSCPDGKVAIARRRLSTHNGRPDGAYSFNDK